MTDKSRPTTPETTELDTSQIIKPNADPSKENTPLAEEAEIAAKAAREPTPIGDEAEEAARSFHRPDFVTPEVAEHNDEEDVAAALERTTQDGKGDEDPGPSDWQGYATEGVEVEESK